MEKDFVDPRYAKTGEYLKDLQEIQKAEKCPFCPGNMGWHKNPILQKIEGWRVTENMRPYPCSKNHFLIIGPEHKENFYELSSADFLAVQKLVSWISDKFKIFGFGVTLRSGDTTYTGATVKHLHFHLIVPEKRKVVNFPIG